MSTMLIKFRLRSENYHDHYAQHDYRGRANVFGYLIDRHGRDAVLRHRCWIRRVLDNTEGFCVVD